MSPQLPSEASFVTAAGQAATPAPVPAAYPYGVINTEQTAGLTPPPVTVEALPPISAAVPPVRRAVPDLGSLGAVRRAPAATATPTVGIPPAPAPTISPQANAVPAAQTAIPATASNAVDTAAAGLAETQQQANVFAAVDYRDRLAAASRRRAEATVIAARPAGSLAKEGGWFSEVMTSALDKYQTGAGLGQALATPRLNILN